MSRKLPGSAIVPGTITVTQITGGLNDTTNASYAQANTARTTANDAYGQANTARDQANTARTQANTAYGQANNAYSSANLAYGQANAAYGAANTRLSASGGTLSGDLIITGNLTVSGNSTTLNTEVLTVEDAEVILLSNVASTPALNAGIIVNRGTSTNTFLRWDEVTDKWGWSDSGTTTYYFDDLRAGLATTNTTFGTINTSLGTINTSYQAAYAQANTAGTNALNAYGQANAAYGAANNRVLKAGDTMTGQVNISAGGLLVTGNSNFDSGTLFVDSVNDRIGIGTTSPGAMLDIWRAEANYILDLTNTSESAFKFRTYNHGSANVQAVVFTQGLYYSTTENATIKYFRGSGGSDGFLTFNTGGAERMRITTSGLVGVSTNAPYSQLHLTGDVTMGSGASARPAFKITNWGYSASYRALLIGSAATGYTTANTGAVTIAFNYDPSVNGNGSFTGDGREIIFRRGTRFVTPSSDNTLFNLTNLVLYDGNVGIGTDTPSGKLHLYQTSGGTNNLILDTNFGSGNAFALNPFIIGVSNGGFSIRDVTNSVDRMVIQYSTGNIGIGTTSPASLLDVRGSLIVNGTGVVNGASLTAIRTDLSSSLSVGYFGTGSQGLFIKNDSSDSKYMQFYSSGNSAGGYRFYVGNTLAFQLDTGAGATFYGSGSFASHVMSYKTTQGSANSDYLSDLDGYGGSSYDGYYAVSRPGYSSGVMQFNVAGSTGTVQFAFSYAAAMYRRNKTDNTTWSSWRQVD